MHYKLVVPTRMTFRTADIETSPRNAIAVLGVLSLALFCLNLFLPRDLWVQDEARYGEVVREMLADGRWLVPYLNGFPYPDKPPLYFWLVAALGSVVGRGELAFRLVSVLSVFAATAGVWQLGRRLADSTVAFWSAALFATLLLTLLVAQIARMDMLLTVAVVYAWYYLHGFYTTGDRRQLLGYWCCFALGLAIKGPIAVFFTLLPGVVWVARLRGLAGLRTLALPAGLAALALTGALWIGAVWQLGESNYLLTVWHEQLVGRAVNAWSHPEPFYFYLLCLPFVLMPWSALIAAGVYRLWREQAPAGWALLCFVALPLLGISLVSGKLFIYLQPLLPGLALAGGLYVARPSRAQRLSAWITWPPALFLGVLAGGVIWLARTQLSDTAAQAYGAAGGLAVLALVGVWLAMRGARVWLHGWLGLSAVTSWLLFGVLTHAVNPLYSARALGESVARLAPPGVPVGVVNTTRGILNYYAGRTFTELSRDETPAWWAKHPDAILIVKQRDLDNVFGPSGVPDDCRVHEIHHIERKEYHVAGRC